MTGNSQKIYIVHILNACWMRVALLKKLYLVLTKKQLPDSERHPQNWRTTLAQALSCMFVRVMKSRCKLLLCCSLQLSSASLLDANCKDMLEKVGLCEGLRFVCMILKQKSTSQIREHKKNIKPLICEGSCRSSQVLLHFCVKFSGTRRYGSTPWRHNTLISQLSQPTPDINIFKVSTSTFKCMKIRAWKCICDCSNCLFCFSSYPVIDSIILAAELTCTHCKLTA